MQKAIRILGDSLQSHEEWVAKLSGSRQRADTLARARHDLDSLSLRNLSLEADKTMRRILEKKLSLLEDRVYLAPWTQRIAHLQNFIATCDDEEKCQSVKKAIEFLHVQHPLLLNARVNAVFLFSPSGLVGASSEGPYGFTDAYPNTEWHWSEGSSASLKFKAADLRSLREESVQAAHL